MECSCFRTRRHVRALCAAKRREQGGEFNAYEHQRKNGDATPRWCAEF
jgi:hypothetical protein